MRLSALFAPGAGIIALLSLSPAAVLAAPAESPASSSLDVSPVPDAAASTPLLLKRNDAFSTCSIRLADGGVLRACCKKIDGSINSTWLALKLFIGNIDGQLAANSGAFDQTCTNCRLGMSDWTGRLICNCKSYSRDAWVESYINLNDICSNYDGWLNCNGYQASYTPTC